MNHYLDAINVYFSYYYYIYVLRINKLMVITLALLNNISHLRAAL